MICRLNDNIQIFAHCPFIVHIFLCIPINKLMRFFCRNRSRKCLDSNGKVTIFAVKKGSDQSFLWKATVRIACVKCDPETNRIESYKLINLREFLKVFNTFQTHLEAMSSCEEQNDRVRVLFCFSQLKKCTFVQVTFCSHFYRV